MTIKHGSLLVFAFALALLLGSLATVIYRYFLPTDGWDVYTTDIDPADWIYWQNLVGAPSGLQRDDILLQVGPSDARGTASNEMLAKPPGWQVGGSVLMRVQRGAQEETLTVPVVAWTPAAFWRFNSGSFSHLLETLGGLLFMALGWFTFWRRPEVPSARALLIFSTAIGANTISNMLPDGLSVQFNPPAYALTTFYSYAIFVILIAPALLAFTLLFPQPKAIIQRRPWLALLPFVVGPLAGLLLFVSDVPSVLGWIGTMGMFAAAILSLIHSAITQRDAVSRAQLRWAVGGVVAGLALFMLNFIPSFNLVRDPVLAELLYSLASFGVVVIGASLSVAVLRYRLFDIDVIIRRTLVYGLLTALLLVVYFGLVLLTQTAFERLTGQESPLAIVISTLVIAALFNPLRRRIQAFIDRRFYRRSYDAAQTLQQFARYARDEVEIDHLAGRLMEAVNETMQPQTAELWLRPHDVDRLPS